MQSPLFEPTNLPQIESAGPLSRAMFEDPILAVIGLGLLGILLMLALRTRGQHKQGLIVFGLALVVAASMWITSTIVTTDRERISNHATQLVHAVANGDESAMRSLLGESVRVQTRFAAAQGVDKVASLAASRVPRLVDEYTITEIRADLPGSQIGRTMVKLRVQGNSVPGGSSWWMIHWQRPNTDSETWNVFYIEPLWIQGINNPGG
tara:strand:- start:92769 stop:93392 length:624 start_codon:yes stop_codon:yes gene_type:complete